MKNNELKWQPDGNMTTYENFMSYYKRTGYSDDKGNTGKKISIVL